MPTKLIFAPIFSEKLVMDSEKVKGIIEEKIGFIERDPRGKRNQRIIGLDGGEFREMHAGEHRIYNVVEGYGHDINVYILYYDLKTSHSYDKKTLNEVRTIYRNLKQRRQTLVF